MTPQEHLDGANMTIVLIGTRERCEKERTNHGKIREWKLLCIIRFSSPQDMFTMQTSNILSHLFNILAQWF